MEISRLGQASVIAPILKKLGVFPPDSTREEKDYGTERRLCSFATELQQAHNSPNSTMPDLPLGDMRIESLDREIHNPFGVGIRKTRKDSFNEHTQRILKEAAEAIGVDWESITEIISIRKTSNWRGNPWFYFDANTGKLLYSWDPIHPCLEDE